METIRGEMAEILLDNILRLFSTEIFGKDKSAYFRMANGIVMLLKYCCIVGVQGKSNVKNGKNENIENRS